MTAAAAIVALISVPQTLSTAIFVGIWSTIFAAAALTYLPPAVAQRWALPIAVVAGVGVGSLASLSGRKGDLMLALPISLLFVPGRWAVARGYGLGNKILASWMMAIAMLSTFVLLTPTPGINPIIWNDHDATSSDDPAVMHRANCGAGAGDRNRLVG